MFTIEALRSRAAQSEHDYQRLLERYPPGTYNEARNDARMQMEVARICVAWLESKGLTQSQHVGPFMAFKLNRGQRVRIKAGARIFGTGNGIAGGGQLNARARVVTVHDFNSGYIDRHADSANPTVVQGRVHWVGAGGYWRWTDVDNVELVEQKEVA